MTITATDSRPCESAAKAVGFADRELPFPLPPRFDSVDTEREYRKSQLADGFRIFSRLGFSEGVTGHITVRDPENPTPSGSTRSARHSRRSPLPTWSAAITTATSWKGAST